MKQLLPILFITTLCFCKTNNAAAQVNAGDSLALVDLYNSTDGAHWTNNSGWLKGPVWTWFGISVENNRVTQIYFDYNNNMNGTLLSSLGSLSELRTFIIYGNNISGEIPSTFSQLTKLITLAIANCNLSGNLPNSLHKLTNLLSLNLSYNQLQGQIPAFLGNMPGLAGIQLDHNFFTGNIPATISNMKSLQILGLSSNQLTGPVPSLINTTHISDLFLNDNQLSGPFPDFHTSNPFGEVHLDNNNFSGPIPAWVSNLTTDQITLSNNQFTSIPTDFVNLKQYAIFYIDNNHFTFDSLEYIIANSTHYYFNYAPQRNIPVNYTASGDYGKLSVHAGGTLSNNTYLWYRNNSLYKTIQGDSTFAPDAAGLYFVKVNNSIVTGLQLLSDSITVVQACATKPANDTAVNIQSISAKLLWDASQGAVKYQVKYKAVGTSVFNTVNTKNNSVTITGLSANTAYQWKVRASCSLRYSGFTALKLFITVPGFATTIVDQSELAMADDFVVYPNPAKSVANIAFNSAKPSAYAITIYDLQGKSLIKKTCVANAGSNNLSLDIHALTRGTYIVKIQSDDKSFASKLVKE